MNLTGDDLQAMREIIKGEVHVIVRATIKEELRPISGELEAPRNDIKDIYDMLTELRNNKAPDKQFQKLAWKTNY